MTTSDFATAIPTGRWKGQLASRQQWLLDPASLAWRVPAFGPIIGVLGTLSCSCGRKPTPTIKVRWRSASSEARRAALSASFTSSALFAKGPTGRNRGGRGAASFAALCPRRAKQRQHHIPWLALAFEFTGRIVRLFRWPMRRLGDLDKENTFKGTVTEYMSRVSITRRRYFRSNSRRHLERMGIRLILRK